MARALIVGDDRSASRAMTRLAESEGFSAFQVTTLDAARSAVRSGDADVVLFDLDSTSGEAGDFLREIRERPTSAVVLVTSSATLDGALEALRDGGFDRAAAGDDGAGSASDAVGDCASPCATGFDGTTCEGDHFGRLVGASPSIRHVYDLISKGAPTDAPVLLDGESGTGKEVAARTIHDLSARRDSTFLPVNCGALPPTLVESELFGHEKGSFTGAAKRRAGCFEQADGGTLFLDEITEMPAEAQVKLLRVLEGSSVTRLGGRDSVEVDVRVIAATNRDPGDAISTGKLRRDLYYRLNVFPISLPPLRERERDAVLLAEHRLAELNDEAGASKELSEAAIETVFSYDWPGNVRELRNAVHRAFIVAESDVGRADLPPEVRRGAAAVEAGPSGDTAEDGSVELAEEAEVEAGVVSLPVGCSIADAQRHLILATLDHLENDKKETARRLGISLRSLYTRLSEYRERGSEG